MGSQIEINDTLQLSPEQGFLKELNLEKHLKHPFSADQFKDRRFQFQGKSGIRLYKAPPVRNFLVENRGGKWIYWGLCHVLSVAIDYEKQVTSGTFKIIYLNTPDEMKKAHELIDRNPATQFFT